MDYRLLDLRQMGRLFQALSDETRLQIVRMLSCGELCVCDLQSALGAYQSRLSFHLRKLKDAGIVSDRKDGRWVYYSLRPEGLEEVRAFLSTIEPAVGTCGAGTEGCCP
jgi:ArsR family transcriptional regulator, arsenate/arsenite/antimonite-responsive transcriptional repressor